MVTTPGGLPAPRMSGVAARIQPSPRVGLAVVAAYACVFVGLVKASGVGYEHLFDSTETTVRAAILPLAAGGGMVAVFLWLARWGGVFTDPSRLSRRLLAGSLPVLMVLVAVLTLVGSSWGSFSVGHVIAITVAAALVGFTEETVFRGILLRSLRTGGRTEAAALLWTAAAFGLFHLTNLALGEYGAPVQVVLAGLSGVGFYVARRVTGRLVAAMALHAVWDLATFVAGVHPGAGPVASAGDFFLVLVYPWAAVILVVLAVRARQVRPVSR